MTTKFILTRDINGYNGFGLIPATDKSSMTLVSNVASSVTVPTNFDNWLAIFGYTPGAEVWVAYNDDAELPTGGPAFTTSEILPSARNLQGGDVINLITSGTAINVGITFYAIP